MKKMLLKPINLFIISLLLIIALLAVNPSSAIANESNSGTIITSPDTDGHVGEFTSLALDSNGFPVVSYYRHQSQDLKLLHCDDPNCEGSNSIATPDPGGHVVGRFTSLDLNRSGFPVISYYANSGGDLRLITCLDANCTSSARSVVDTDHVAGAYSSLVLDGSDYPVISYYNHTGRNLKLLRCTKTLCIIGDHKVEIDTPDDVGRYTSLALDRNSYPVISYYDNSAQNLKLARCNDRNCDPAVNGADRVVVLDSEGDVGKHSSLALDSNGYPVISYLAVNDLKLVHCNDPNCDPNVNGPESFSIVDSNGGVGQYTSLELDANGYPVISYYGNGTLKLAHCNDPNCDPNVNGGERISTVDQSANVGLYTSLELDRNGYPVISYYDATNRDLKIAHCVNADCLPSCVSYESGFANDGYLVGTVQRDTVADLIRAIECANANGTSDKIILGNNISIPTANNATGGSNGLPVVTSDITLEGAGFTLARGINYSCDGSAPGFRLFYVAQAGNLTLNNMTVQNGCISGNGDAGKGGAIHVVPGATLNLFQVMMLDNGGEFGGAVFNSGLVNVTGSTFANNLANLSGGAIANQNRANIGNSTFSANRAGAGGAIYEASLMYVDNSTFVDNVGNYGSTFYGSRSPYVTNSIIAFGSGGDNCAGIAHFFSSSNISSDTSCGSSTKRDRTLLLGPLQDNGGPTLTHALLPRSAAIDAGNSTACAANPINNLDQRGIARPQGAGCDVGAYEIGVVAVTQPVLTMSATGALSWTPKAPNSCIEGLFGSSTDPYGDYRWLEDAPLSNHDSSSSLVDPNINYFYYIEANCGTSKAGSNRVGEFTFTIVPGK